AGAVSVPIAVNRNTWSLQVARNMICNAIGRQAYFDESGTHATQREPLLILAGYVAEQEKWVAFNNAWAAVLAEFKIDRFHMKDLRNLRHKRFKHLSPQNRRELLSLLIDLTAATA